MGQVPFTQAQLPLEAILDINGKQTYLGNAWILPQNGKSLTDTNEDFIALIQNPSGSGKSLFLFSRKVSTDNNNVVIRYYINPTVNSIGSPTSALNLRTGSTAVSISRCYLSSTITSNGTLIATLPASVYTIYSDVLFILDPGSSLLITGQQETMGTTNVFSENIWYEI